MAWFETLLRKCVPHKEIGWEEIGERFTRYQLLKTPLCNVYLHQLDAPSWHEQCHDHPWSFLAILLKGGYYEDSGRGPVWRSPGRVLYRSAEHSHNVVTKGTSWSMIFTGPKRRQWGFLGCGERESHE